MSEHWDGWCFHFARGWLALRQGEQERAEELFERALELLRRSPLRLETTEVLTALAITYQQLGRLDAAREHLAEAQWLVAQCPDGYLLADPRQVPAPARSAAANGNPPQLTGREAEVLGLLAEGLTTREIAAGQLHISPRTVDAHLRSVYLKIDVRTRTGATRYALEHRVVG